MKQLSNKKIGIWGYGIVGASARRYLEPITPHISIFDHKELPAHLRATLQQHNICIYLPTELSRFLDEHDYIVASPGIDLIPYQAYAEKFLSECDLFFHAWHKKSIAITGTIGKTTITHIISELLRSTGMHVATGGNIGTGMLDLIAEQDAATYAVLELSSFQLELSKNTQPDIAVITNIFPNHLDRHKSYEQYCTAKYQIFRSQHASQHAIVPFDIIDDLRLQFPHKRFIFFLAEAPSPSVLAQLRADERLYYLHRDTIFVYQADRHASIADLTQNHISYQKNWLIIYAVLDLMEKAHEITDTHIRTLTVPDHRLSCIADYDGIRFYNDSKSTVPEAMLAAVNKLTGSPIILFLGGMSKGVDRTPSIRHLQSAGIKEVICFGGETQQLHKSCAQFEIPATSHATLEAAFIRATDIAQSGDQILFSPAGASFDLFKDYQERGERFKELVVKHTKR